MVLVPSTHGSCIQDSEDQHPVYDNDGNHIHVHAEVQMADESVHVHNHGTISYQGS